MIFLSTQKAEALNPKENAKKEGCSKNDFFTNTHERLKETTSVIKFL
jgi:hypothetical protein